MRKPLLAVPIVLLLCGCETTVPEPDRIPEEDLKIIFQESGSTILQIEDIGKRHKYKWIERTGHVINVCDSSGGYEVIVRRKAPTGSWIGRHCYIYIGGQYREEALKLKEDDKVVFVGKFDGYNSILIPQFRPAYLLSINDVPVEKETGKKQNTKN